MAREEAHHVRGRCSTFFSTVTSVIHFFGGIGVVCFTAMLTVLNECWKMACCVRFPKVNWRLSYEVSSFDTEGVVRVQPSTMNRAERDSVSDRNSFALTEVLVENESISSTSMSSFPDNPPPVDAKRRVKNRIKMGLRSTSHGSDYDNAYADVIVNENPMPSDESVVTPMPKRNRPAYQCHRRYNSIAPVNKNRRPFFPHGFSQTPTEWMPRSSAATDKNRGNVTSSEEEGSTTLWDRVIFEVQSSKPNYKKVRRSLNMDFRQADPQQRMELVRPYDPPRPPPISPFCTRTLWDRLIFDVENSTTNTKHGPRSQNLTYHERDANCMELVHPSTSAPRPPLPPVPSICPDSPNIYDNIDYSTLRCNLHGVDQQYKFRSLPPLLPPRPTTRPLSLPPPPPPALPPRLPFYQPCPPFLPPRPPNLPPRPPNLLPRSALLPPRSPFTFCSSTKPPLSPTYIQRHDCQSDYSSIVDSDEESFYETISSPDISMFPANKDQLQSKICIPTWLFPEHNRQRRNALVPLPDGLFYFKQSPPTGIVDKNCQIVNLSDDKDLDCSGRSTDEGDKNEKSSRQSSNSAIQKTFSLYV